ncbi:MAG: hypothetical protein U5O69_09910 [Candidatus Competibacteraceae bacterium]|nr:hypothetical protein [Candidatus Competibacteraceae bacterium]
MSMWQLTNALVLLVVLAVIAIAGWLFVGHARKRKQRIEERVLAMRRVATERAATEKAAAERAAAEKAAIARAVADRSMEKRAAMERAAQEKAALEKAALEQAIAQWAAAERAEADRSHLRRSVDERRVVEEVEERMRAVEAAIAEWLEAEREGGRLAVAAATGQSARKTYTRTEAIHQQVRLTAEKVEKEAQELEFIKNRIQAGVDFLPIEVGLTIAQWKEGRIYRHRTFDDLKLKFRFQAYSIEDGYELLYRYQEWMAQQRQKLWVFIRLLGGKADQTESIQAAIEQVERGEREKHLEMDVDVIFTLNDIRAMLEKLIGMESILKELDAVCHKRAEQVISPSWEAKGSL